MVTGGFRSSRFYLKQGLKIAHRYTLLAMTGEVDLADANFTKAQSKKVNEPGELIVPVK